MVSVDRAARLVASTIAAGGGEHVFLQGSGLFLVASSEAGNVPPAAELRIEYGGSWASSQELRNFEALVPVPGVAHSRFSSPLGALASRIPGLRSREFAPRLELLLTVIRQGEPAKQASSLLRRLLRTDWTGNQVTEV